MEYILYVIDLIYELYKFIVLTIFTIYFFLFLIIGGSINIEIYWDNFIKIFQ